MSTIALKLFAGEREEKAREREVPGYTVWLPAQPAVTYFQIKYTKSWNTVIWADSVFIFLWSATQFSCQSEGVTGAQGES